MLRPVIMIGCGGSGQKAVRYVRDAVRRRLMHAGWDGPFPTSWQFIGIDTLTTQEDPSIPFLPANDYVSVSLQFATYSNLAAALNAKFPMGSPGFREMMGWQPNPSQVQVPLQAGAGQLRAVGRAAGVLALQNVVQSRIAKAFSECQAGGPQLSEVSQKLGVNVPPGTPTPSPLTIVVGSMAGGTGAGIMLDIIDLIRRSHVDGSFPVMVSFTPDIFGSIATDQMTANSAAFMAEMLSAYWDDENADAVLVPAQVQVGTRGPHSTFVIGRKNMDGLDLGDSKNVYRAVGEALAAVTTSVKVQTKFHNFVTTNWAAAAPANQGGFGWHDSQLKGALSSFGSTTLSIGRDRFREYLTKLLQRSIIEFLYSGYEQASISLLGEVAAKGMSADVKILELARMHKDEFLVSCGLQEAAGRQQVSNRFLSNEAKKAEFQRIANDIKQGMPTTTQQEFVAWSNQIRAQAVNAEVASLKRAEDEASAEVRQWSNDLFATVLQSVTDFAGRFSLPVVIKILEMVRADLVEAAASIKAEAAKSRNSVEDSLHLAQQAGSEATKGRIAFTAAPVNNCMTAFSRAVAFKWTARIQDQLSVALEAISSGMISSIQSGMMQAVNRLNTLITPQDGRPAVISMWPKNDGVVPPSFTPSPVEFYLEDYISWPSRAKELLENSLDGAVRQVLSSDPVQAARTLIIQGGYAKKKDENVSPFVWAETPGGGKPRWSVGVPATVVVGDELEDLSERIDTWLQRPATQVSRFLSEGLASYLSIRDEISGAPIADHSERLSSFRQKLQEALNQSRPLVEIDVAMNATVHPKDPEIELNIQGFPFGEGHPARSITRDVVQGFMQTPDDIDWIFSGSETESVLISSFLEYPVSPSVVTSFTQPMTQSLARIQNPDHLRSSFWLWRRARILENFIPLPDELRRSAIRGFAIARSLGYMTATVTEANRISTRQGVLEFPRHLLTTTNTNNVLPALLEAMILTFADAPIHGKKAFAAYGALIDYGTGGGLVDEFSLPDDMTTFLAQGQLQLSPVDEQRATAVKASEIDQRCANVITYLDGNIKRYERLKNEPLHANHWRESVGAVNPTDTLSLEIIDDLLSGFVQVRSAVERARIEDVSVA